MIKSILVITIFAFFSFASSAEEIQNIYKSSPLLHKQKASSSDELIKLAKNTEQYLLTDNGEPISASSCYNKCSSDSDCSGTCNDCVGAPPNAQCLDYD